MRCGASGPSADELLTAFAPVVEQQRTTLPALESTKGNCQQLAVLWHVGQARFAQAGPNRKHVVAESTTHEGIVTERPEIIANAVDDVLRAIRQRGGSAREQSVRAAVGVRVSQCRAQR